MAFSAEQLNIIVSARTKELEKQLDRATSRVKRFERQTNGDLGRASKSFAALAVAARGLLPALGAAVVVQNIKRVTAQMDTIGKKADQIGLTTDALQELTFVAEGAGVSQEKFTSSMERFSKRLGEATLGIGAASKMLKTMGLDAKELTQIPLDQALSQVADKMAQIKDPTQRAAAAAAIFGREGVAMVNLLREGSDGLDRMRQAANDAGAVIDEKLIREAEEAQTRLDAAARVINAQLAIGLSNLTPLLVGAAEGFADLAKRVGDFIKAQEPSSLAVNQLISDIDFIKSLMGEGVTVEGIVSAGAVEEVLDMAEATEELSEKLSDMKFELGSTRSAINNMSSTLRGEARQNANALKTELHELMEALGDLSMRMEGGMNVDQVNVEMTTMIERVAEVQAALIALDEQKFGNLGGALGGIIEILNRVKTAAFNAAMSMPGAAGGGGIVSTFPGMAAGGPMGLVPLTPPGTGDDTTTLTDPAGGGKDPHQKLKADLESLREYLDEYRMSETEAQIAEFETRQQVLEEALNKELLTQEEFNRLKEENQREHSQKIADIVAAERSVRLGEMSSMFSALADIAEHGGKKAVKAQAVLSAAATMIAAYENAVTAAAKAQTIPGKIAAYAGFLAQGLAAVKQIQSVGNSARATSGGGGGAGAGAAAAPQVSRNVAIQLTGGDMYSRDQVIRLINGINEAVEDGAVVRLV